VGFPLGATTKESKAFEAQQILQSGGNEVDMVLNIGALMDKDFRTVFEDVKAVVDACKRVNKDAVIKVILETGYLSKEQIIDASLLSVLAGATFVKTSTGKFVRNLKFKRQVLDKAERKSKMCS
jgi:deoxyribose-phosphate aldolase